MTRAAGVLVRVWLNQLLTLFAAYGVLRSECEQVVRCSAKPHRVPVTAPETAAQQGCGLQVWPAKS